MIIIDRIEEGVAICQDGDAMMNIQLSQIAGHVHEGDVLITNNEGMYQKDTDATCARREHIDSRFARMLSRGKDKRRRREQQEAKAQAEETETAKRSMDTIAAAEEQIKAQSQPVQAAILEIENTSKPRDGSQDDYDDPLHDVGYYMTDESAEEID